jgi:hypothetical protein
MWWLFSPIFSTAMLYAVRALDEYEYISQECISITDCSVCIDSINNNWYDTSKCVPIVPSIYADEEDSSYTKTITCASSKTVDSKKYSLDFHCSNDSLSQETKVQIADLRYMVKWALYSYSAKSSDNLLSDMVIIENINLESRAVLGYDKSRNYIIVSFRGSSTLQNWISDFNFPLVDYTRTGCSSCSVHTGFLNSYSSISSSVLSTLSLLHNKYPQSTVAVTGHSLGGAQAVLGAIDVQQAGYTSHLYTYGCPRVGNQNFVNFFNSLINAANIRAVYLDDPVPNLPPIAFKYYHGGTEIHFYSCNDYLAYPKFSDEAEMIDLLAVGDHSKYNCTYLGVEDSRFILDY